MNDMEKMIDPIEEVPGFGNGPDAWARWRRFLATPEKTKKQREGEAKKIGGAAIEQINKDNKNVGA